MGITVFRESSKKVVYSGLESKIELIQKIVELDPRLEKKAQAIKYKVKRPQNRDSLHRQGMPQHVDFLHQDWIWG